MLSRNLGAARTLTRELPVRLVGGGRDVAAERRLHKSVDVAGIQAVPGGLFPVHLDIEIGLAQHAEDAEVGNARNLLMTRLTWVASSSSLNEVRPDDLDRVRALHAGQALLDIVLNILREIEVDPGELLGELILQVLDQIFLVPAGRPLFEGLRAARRIPR